jgi:hypothetical protein
VVAFDATVLSGALLKPNGINFEVLVRAAEGVPFRGFTTDVAGVEFVRNALEGLAQARPRAATGLARSRSSSRRSRSSPSGRA